MPQRQIILGEPGTTYTVPNGTVLVMEWVSRGHLEYTTRDLALIDTFVLHYAGVEDDAKLNGYKTALWQTTKMEGDLFPEIAYHYGILPNGIIEWYHDLNVRTWGVANHNDHTVHCIVYGVGLNSYPHLLQEGPIHWLGRPRSDRSWRLELKGHQELNPSACPGPGIMEWIREVRGEVRDD